MQAVASGMLELSETLTDEEEHEGLVVGMPDAVVYPGTCTTDTSHSSAVIDRVFHFTQHL